MPALAAGLLWAGLVAWLILRAARQFSVHRAASLVSLADGAPTPRLDLAVVVPARNEIANIGDCLACLAAQRGLDGNCPILVVDDGSRDGTAQAVADAAQRDPRIGLLDPGRLPAGWMGKPHACWQGALATKSEWLCFIDADVRTAPELVAAAVAAAEHHGIDMLSLHPFQVLGSFWERLIVPAGLVLVACTQDLRLIDDPDSGEVSANGQFILIRRDAYFAVGGHQAVRGEICEDKALATGVKRSGRRYRMLAAEELARTRMYTDFRSLWEGFGKNATEILGDSPTTVAAAAAALVAGWSALLLPVLTGSIAWHAPSAAAWIGFTLALLGSLAIAGIEVGAARHFRIPWAYGLIFPLAYTAVAALAWHSAWLRRGGRVTWKGRTYRLDRRT